MRYYCTYFDRNYLTRAVALIESLRRHEHGPFRIYAVCMDELSRLLLTKAALPNVVPIPIHEIETGDDAVLTAKRTRSLVEYYWTMTPTIILRLLERYPAIDVLTYLDADLYFFSSPQPIFDELGEGSVLIHAHRFSPAQAALATHNGKYNVGLLCFRRDQQGLAAVRWWRERCLEWCSARYEDGKLGDQMYLNDWPTRFMGVVELEHIGGGVGPWNHDQYRVAIDAEGRASVDGRPLIFYHFHSFTLMNRDVILPVKHTHYVLTRDILAYAFVPYTTAVLDATSALQRLFPEFPFGFNGDVRVTADHTFLARRVHVQALAAKQLPHRRMELDGKWDAYCSPQVRNGESSVRQPGREAGEAKPRTTPAQAAAYISAGSRKHREARQDSHYELLDFLQGRPIAEQVRTLYLVGAHLFQERQLVDRLFPNLQAICLFEPIPQFFTALKRLEQADPRIRVFPYALSDTEGPADFHVTDNQGESSSLLRMGKHREIFPHVHEAATIQVECRRLDRVIRDHGLPRPDMLFLDVQGAEFKILSTLPRTEHSGPRLLYVEASLEEVYQGAKNLDDLKQLLAPQYEFVGFTPLSKDSPTHGNALFVRREDAALLGQPADHSGPSISVIVSSYKAEAFMWECLEDLERQTIAGQIEIIVVDAASPENERAVVEAFQQRYRNITYIRTAERIGVYAAWNLAIKIARGAYVTPFSTNDRLRPDAYELMAKALSERPDVALVYGDTYLTAVPHETFERHTRSGVWQWPEYNYEDLLRHCRIGPHPMWRRAIHDTVGYFDEQYQALGDQEFWLRLGEDHQLLHLPVVTGLYWKSTDGLSNRPELYVPEERRLRETYLKRHAARRQHRPETGYTCSIIIPVWNKCELTYQCLTALPDATSETSYEVILVDNGSTDDTARLLDALSGDVQVIRNRENLGFARACNQGAKSARGRYLVFLNNDTIPQQGWLKALVDEVESHDDVAVVGSKLLYPDGTIQHAGVGFSRVWFTPYHLYRGFNQHAEVVNRRREFQAVTAACMLMRREVFEKLDGFDEGYKNGFEDVDLCLRVRELGGRIIYQPKSVLYHLESQTTGRKAHDQDNAKRLQERWGHMWWLPDEDAILVPDGYAVRTHNDNGTLNYCLTLLRDPSERARWELVADAQCAAQRRDIRALHDCLARAEEWPDEASVLRWAAHLCRWSQAGQWSERFWRRLLTVEEAPDARAALAQSALMRGELDQAAEHLEMLHAHAPAHGEGWLLSGVLAVQRMDYAEAMRAFGQAEQYGADSRKTKLGLVMASVGDGRHEMGWEKCLALRDDHPDDPEVLHWLVRIGTALGRWEPLVTQLTQFIARNPGDLATRFALAGVLVRAGKAQEARQEFSRVRLLAPDYEGLDELEQAIEGMTAELESAKV